MYMCEYMSLTFYGYAIIFKCDSMYGICSGGVCESYVNSISLVAMIR